MQSAGVELVVRDPDVEGLTIVSVSPSNVVQAFDLLAGDSLVQYVEPDYLLEPASMPNDPSYGIQWGLQDVRLPFAWDLWTGETAPDFRIAVIDMGVDYDHPDLIGNIWTNPLEQPGDANGDGCPGICGVDDDGDGYVDELIPIPDRIPLGSSAIDDDDENGWVDDIHGFDFAGTVSTQNPNGHPDADPYPDGSGHGTHVAGIIGAVTNNATGVSGVNWRCKIVALKVFSGSSAANTSDVIEAMTYVIRNGIRVSNNSYIHEPPGFSQGLYDKILEAQSIGHIFVSAAGNQGWDVDVMPVYHGSYDLPNIINVSGSYAGGGIMSGSNFGFVNVDLGAPGNSVYSTWWFPGPPVDHTYLHASGTSMAAPHVAGVVALLWGYKPNLTWQGVKNRILNSARPHLYQQGKSVTGGGLDAIGALGDCNVNGIQDAIDISSGTSSDCDKNKVPDECQYDCDGNGVPDVCDGLPLGPCCLSTTCVDQLTQCVCEARGGVFSTWPSCGPGTCEILPYFTDPGGGEEE